MNNFEKPVIEIIEFECEDVVTTSIPSIDNGGFNNTVVKP